MPIDDSSAINQLKNYHKNPRIFNIPTNADISKSGYLRKVSDSKAIYSLKVFPRWGVCMIQLWHTNSCREKNGSFICPSCRNEEIQRMNRVTGIRFVVACYKGHLDDVDWPSLVHQNGRVLNVIKDLAL